MFNFFVIVENKSMQKNNWQIGILNNSFLKFLMVGVFNTCIGTGIIFFCFYILSFHYWLATFLGHSTGAVVSFFLNKNFTFQGRGNFFRFIMVIIVCYVFSYKIAFHLVGLIFTRFIETYAICFGMFFYTITNYLGQRIFVFSR